MAQKTIHVPANSGAAFEVQAGQTFTVRGVTVVDFVAFALHDHSHRFDQARTKSNQNKIYVSTGDYLVSKRNELMFRIVEDEFREGHHDLQYGTCNSARWRWALEHGVASQTYGWGWDVTERDFPDHGCLENIMDGLREYPISSDDVPSPFNIFQHTELDAATGVMEHTRLRPESPARVSLLALMDCLIAISACPDLTVSKVGTGTTQ
jgi:uncharacterized protein